MKYDLEPLVADDQPSKAARILIVEDDPSMQRMLSTFLDQHLMRTVVVSGRQGLQHALSVREPDLIVMDLHLGEEDGLELLRELRADVSVPVILITGHRRDELDRILGLELGADDYMTKPFNPRELLARIRAILRRRNMDMMNPPKRRERTYCFSGWVFNQRQRELRNPEGQPVPLTKGEFTLLSAFVEAPRRTLSREHLLNATRVHEDVYDRSIDVQILRLRRRLEYSADAPRLIRTERGVGYVLDADVNIR